MNHSEDDKQSLIDLIKWYRDEYHHKDFGHTEMINKIPSATKEELEVYYKSVDGWLDNL